MTKPVIRFVDIETAPNLAHVWGMWKANIGVNQVVQDDYIMSYCYKDLGEEHCFYDDCRESFLQRKKGDKRKYKTFIKGLRDMLDKADIIVGHNGKKFDIPWIQGQCVLLGLKPPSPFKQIDTLLEARKAFRFPRYSLDYLTKRFKLTAKLKHKNFIGHDLWMECMLGNMEAWDEMEEYNVNDVYILEELYLAIRPYILQHPNLGVFNEEGEGSACPKCGGHHINYRGYYTTNLAKYHKFQCMDCGAWGRDRTNVLTKVQRKILTTNAL
jgi:hypothetical protein